MSTKRHPTERMAAKRLLGDSKMKRLALSGSKFALGTHRSCRPGRDLGISRPCLCSWPWPLFRIEGIRSVASATDFQRRWDHAGSRARGHMPIPARASILAAYAASLAASVSARSAEGRDAERCTTGTVATDGSTTCIGAVASAAATKPRVTHEVAGTRMSCSAARAKSGHEMKVPRRVPSGMQSSSYSYIVCSDTSSLYLASFVF